MIFRILILIPEMRDKLVNKNTDFICKPRNQHCIILKEVSNTCNITKSKKSRVTHPCQYKKCAKLSLKKAGSHPIALIKKYFYYSYVKSDEAIKKYQKITVKKSRAAHPCQTYTSIKEVIKNYKKVLRKNLVPRIQNSRFWLTSDYITTPL